MLVRAFRLTDKFTNAFLKLNIYLTLQLIERVVGLRHALEATAQAFVTTGSEIVKTASRRNQPTNALSTEVIGRGMVQRSDERALQEVKVIEDPLIARNRSLSAIAVILLVALIGLLIWSPPGREQNRVSFGSIPTRPAGEVADPEIPTPQTLPSPTPNTTILTSISGTLVFTLRQHGQDDLWALPAGSGTPIRLTDNLTDDRDPAWSPDGTRLAFASRRDGPWDLYIMNVQSGDVRRLTSTMSYDGAPTWSPDGAFLAYEAYNPETENIDLYIVNTTSEGQCLSPCFLMGHPDLPDLEPAWRPGEGRQIAYVGYRNGERDILLLDLENPAESSAINLTSTPDVAESYPQWSPDGSRLAYTAEVEGIPGIYVQDVDAEREARLVGRGIAATWNPFDNASLFFATQRGTGSELYLGQVDNFGAGASAINFLGRITDLDWSQAGIGFAGFSIQSSPLYVEDMEQQANDLYEMKLLPNVTSPDPFLSDAVNDSYEAMRRRTVELVGIDILGNLESAFWRLDIRPEPGQDQESWHYTGRAFALDRNLIFAGSPTPILVIREETEAGTTWRVMARVVESAQNGALGEPLRDLPWDFASRTTGDATAFEEGGRLMDSVPSGYYVDLTRLFSDFGWERVIADRAWRREYSGIRFWEFEKREGLSWLDAMRQIYGQADINAFLSGQIRPQVTPLPSATPAPTEVPGGDRPRTPTPLPPDLNS